MTKLHRAHNVTEGLVANALDHLIIPLITVDEYESKIDDRRVIVVGFYVNDLDPAEDLSNFIDKSNLDILDTEVSPAPTPDGYYVVFVEIRRDEEFPSIVMDMLGEIKNLCMIDEWEMKYPGAERPKLVTKESLEQNLILDDSDIPIIPDVEEPSTENKEDDDRDHKNKDPKEKDVDESVQFWKNASSDKIELDESTITIYKNGYPYSYEIIEKPANGAMQLFETTAVTTLQNLLGPAYTVWGVDTNLVVESNFKIWTLKIIP